MKNHVANPVKLKCYTPDGKELHLSLQPIRIPQMVFSRSLLPTPQYYARAFGAVLWIVALSRTYRLPRIFGFTQKDKPQPGGASNTCLHVD